jgi:ribonuclease Z
MNFTLNIMGSASAKPIIDRFQSAQVLSVHGRLFLIDCGEGVQLRLQQAHISFQKIDSLFISHIHGDHVFGIFGLLSTMGMLGRQIPLNIYAPNSFGGILKFFLSYYGEGIGFEIRHIVVKAKEPEVLYETKTLSISAVPLNHGIETYGYIFREKTPQRNVYKPMIERYGLTLTEIGTLKRGEDVVREDCTLPNSELTYLPWEPRSYAYISDTAPFPELPQWLHGIDVLYHECTYTSALADQAAQRHHSTTLQAAQCALDAEASNLLIGHFSSRERDAAVYERECRSIFPETVAVNDGDTFDFPLKKNL